jgi:hypothetical protein
MLRISMENFVRMTVRIVVVLVGREIGLGTATEPLLNIQKHPTAPQGTGFFMPGQVS